MIKIKRFSFLDHATDEDINNFMKDKNVLDVKLCADIDDPMVMVIYKENEDD